MDGLQWIQSTLSEVDQKIEDMVALMQDEEEGRNSFPEKRHELLIKIMDGLHKSYHSLSAHCDQLSARSSISSSVVEDPDLECNNNNKKDVFVELMKEDTTFFEDLQRDVSLSDRLSEQAAEHLQELARGNEEKREANRELAGRIEKLKKENCVLVEQHRKVVDENAALCMRVHELMQKKKKKHNKSQLSRLKALLLNAQCSLWRKSSVI